MAKNQLLINDELSLYHGAITLNNIGVALTKYNRVNEAKRVLRSSAFVLKAEANADVVLKNSLEWASSQMATARAEQGDASEPSLKIQVLSDQHLSSPSFSWDGLVMSDDHIFVRIEPRDAGEWVDPEPIASIVIYNLSMIFSYEAIVLEHTDKVLAARKLAVLSNVLSSRGDEEGTGPSTLLLLLLQARVLFYLSLAVGTREEVSNYLDRFSRSANQVKNCDALVKRAGENGAPAA